MYYLYLITPYTIKVYESPYKNAKIKVVNKGRNIFFAYNVGPVDSHYDIVYDNCLIERIGRYSIGSTDNNILNITWYKDSVAVLYKKTDINTHDTISVTYKFDLFSIITTN